MNNVIWVGTNENVLHDPESGTTIIEVLFPKGFQLNDYDPDQNLIEIENCNNGERFWINPFHLFKRDLRKGIKKKVVDIYPLNPHMYNAYLSKFNGIIRRKRCYLQAIFLRYGEIEPFNLKTDYPKLKDLNYQGLYIIPEPKPDK